MHPGGRPAFSTSRLSLGSVLAQAGDEGEIGKEVPKVRNDAHEPDVTRLVQGITLGTTD